MQKDPNSQCCSVPKCNFQPGGGGSGGNVITGTSGGSRSQWSRVTDTIRVFLYDSLTSPLSSFHNCSILTWFKYEIKEHKKPNTEFNLPSRLHSNHQKVLFVTLSQNSNLSNLTFKRGQLYIIWNDSIKEFNLRVEGIEVRKTSGVYFSYFQKMASQA